MKILIFNVPTQGHINPTLPITAELAQRGVQVIYYLTEGHRKRIEATGAEFRPYPMLQDDYFESKGLDGSNPPRTARTLIETSRDLLPTLIGVVQKEQPAVIVHDAMCPWGWLVAKHAKLPTVSSMSTMMLTPRLILKSGQFPNLIALMIKNYGYLREFNRIAGEVSRTYGTPKLSFPDAVSSTGTITLNYTSALLQAGSESLDRSIKFVGPSITPRADTTDFPLDQLRHPLIYISLGTVINENRDFYTACLQAFAGTPYQVVMAVGNKIDLTSLGAIPENFIVRNFVPQLDILQRADLFITHAGLNSVHEGLYYDVPLLLVPQQSEQRLTASRIQELGAGIALKQVSPTPAQILQESQRLLQKPHYREQAKIVGESLRSAGGYLRAADEIMALC